MAGEVPGGHEPVAAVVAGAAQDEEGAIPGRSVSPREGVRGGRHGRAGMLHEAPRRSPSAWARRSAPGHRLGGHRRTAHRIGPACGQAGRSSSNSSGSSAGSGVALERNVVIDRA